MTESTARAERVKPQSSTSPVYLWEVTQKPVSVRLPYDVIDRLEKEVVESFRSLTSRGSEIGGVLLGSAAPGNPAVVAVDDFELIACDYSRGPLYRLSDADRSRFERAVQERQGGQGPTVVGYFRSHTRKGLSLDAEDVSFLEARFHEPHQIALLVRPYATKASTAGIFLWEGGALRPDASALEFPFRSSQLIAFRPSPAAEPAAAPPPVETPATPQLDLPAAPKPAARAQIVPIATRREIHLPPPPPPAAEAPRTEPAPAVEEKAVVPAPAPAPVAEPADALPAAESKGKFGWIAGAVAAVALLLVSLFVYPGFLRHGSIPSAAGNNPALALRVERTGTDILLTWNRDSEAIRGASHAVLSIFDGDRHENYTMDLGQLRNGSIVYSPITADVSFRMDVTLNGKNAPVSESVRVLRTRPSPMGGDEAATPAQPAKPSAAPAPGAAPTPDATATPDAADDSTPTVTATATKPFDSQSLVKRLRPAAPSETLDAPSINPRVPSAGTPSTITGLNLNSTAPAPTAPVATAAPATPARKTVSGGQITQAVLVSRKEPLYPNLARQMGVKGVVELTATIGTDGRVKSVKIERGHPILAKAATDAVMQWVYKPTLLNGQPVQNDTHITLNFLSER